MVQFTPDFIVLYVLYIFVGLIALYVFIRAFYSKCYTDLLRPAWLPNQWVLGAVALLAYVVSFIGVIVAYPHMPIQDQFNLIVLFIFDTALLIYWTMITFNMCSLNVGLFFITASFILQLAVILYIWYYSLAGSLLQIPYALYLFYLLVINSGYALDNIGGPQGPAAAAKAEEDAKKAALIQKTEFQTEGADLINIKPTILE
jgi:tryptophan-rich sensory protein